MFKTICASIFLFFTLFETHAQHAFTVYAFIPWESAHNNVQNMLHAYSIKPIKIIYENAYYTDGVIDLEKIKHIAANTDNEPNIPISFDMEFGSRFKPETVLPRAHEILTAYRTFQGKALIGMYATLPQNTYGLSAAMHSYDALNAQYKPLAQDVDFLSPSLYNYEGANFQAWKKTARYTMKAAKKYAEGKPIIPFISPVYRLGTYPKIRNGTLVAELDEEAMKKRIELLYDLGASGCIIWASSQDRNKEGQKPSFSADKAWGKAVVAFIKKHATETKTM